MADKLIQHPTGEPTAAFKRLRDMGDGTYAELVAAYLSALLAGEDQTLDRHWGGAKAGYTQITTNGTTTIKAAPGILYGVEVVTAGVASSVTVFNNVTNSGDKIIDAAATDIVRACYTPGPESMAGDLDVGITVVTAGTTPATINIWWL